jgi:hypothetical protein
MMDGQLPDRLLDTLLGGREDDRRALRRGHQVARLVALEPADVFVEVVRLPARSLSDAQAAIALQLDRMIPFPPEQCAWDVATMPGDAGEGARRRFALAAVPSAALARARENTPKQIEGFTVDAHLEDHVVTFLFQDSASQARRRSRRVSLVACALSALAATAFLGWSLEDRAARQHAAAEAYSLSITQRIAEARQRETEARAIAEQAGLRSHGDALNVALAVHDWLALTQQKIAVERFSADPASAQLSGFVTDPEGFEQELRLARGAQVVHFSAASSADPFDRGVRVDVSARPAPP